MNGKTHENFGKLFTVMALPLAVKYGVLPEAPTFDNFAGDPIEYLVNCVPLIIGSVVAFRGGVWGAGYPDIDHPSAEPAKKNVVIHKLFRLFGVKHRGRFSHSLASITLTFGALYFFVQHFMTELFTKVAVKPYVSSDTREYLFSIATLGDFISIFLVFAWVGAVSHWLGDMLTTDGAYILWERKIRMFRSSIFKTGGWWEDIWNFATERSYVFAVIYIVMILFFQVNLIDTAGDIIGQLTK